MFPCLIVPTQDLFIGVNEHTISQPITIPMVTLTPPVILTTPSRLLDEKTGLAILTYLYNSKSLFGDDDTGDDDDDDAYYNNNNRGSSSFIPLPQKKKGYESVSIVQKTKALYNLYPRVDNIRFIDRWFLIKHGLTLYILLTECQVEITNLKKAGIVATFDDLLEIDFQITDLVVNRELFNVGHIVQLYGMDATTLKLGIEDLIECQFKPAELLTLQFSLPDMIENDGMRGRHLQTLGYDLQSLILLGLNKKHLRKLGVTLPIAVSRLGWSFKEVNEMV